MSNYLRKRVSFVPAPDITPSEIVEIFVRAGWLKNAPPPPKKRLPENVLRHFKIEEIQK